MPVEIRTATIDDVVAIRTMHAQSWRATYPDTTAGVSRRKINRITSKWLTPTALAESKVYLGRVFDDPDQFYRVALLDGAVVGFIHCITQGGVPHLAGLYTAQEVHGSGLADQLMATAQEYLAAAPADLEVASYNARAIAFYRRHGFAVVPGSDSDMLGIPIITMSRAKPRSA